MLRESDEKERVGERERECVCVGEGEKERDMDAKKYVFILTLVTLEVCHVRKCFFGFLLFPVVVVAAVVVAR